MSYILSTPASILSKAQEHFKNAALRVVPLEGFPFAAAELTLSDKIPPVILRGCVESEVFVEKIAYASRQLMNNQAMMGYGKIVLDSNDFTLLEPLKDWQLFQRKAFEATGKNCHELFIRYLISGDAESRLELFQLGISPEQTEQDAGQDVYLKELIRLIPKDKKQLFSERYPQAKARILKADRDEVVRQSQQNARNFYQQTLKKLQDRVIGQDRAVESMAQLLATQQHDPRNNQIFLFVGPSGVGKTELAKATASIKGDRFISLNMNTYTSTESVHDLFGSGIGYVGSTDLSTFAKKIKAYGLTPAPSEGEVQVFIAKDVVVLFDEFEKAHPAVKQSLLTLFDEKFCIFNYTNGSKNISVKYRFESSIFICTSNLFQEEILASFKAGIDSADIVRQFEALNSIAASNPHFAAKVLSPELLGRLGSGVIPFGPIQQGVPYQKLAALKINSCFKKITDALQLKSIELQDPVKFYQFIEESCYGEGVNIRRLLGELDRMQSAIHIMRNDWLNLSKTLKLEISLREGQLWGQCYWFHSDLEQYVTLDAPVKLL